MAFDWSDAMAEEQKFMPIGKQMRGKQKKTHVQKSNGARNRETAALTNMDASHMIESLSLQSLRQITQSIHGGFSRAEP